MKAADVGLFSVTGVRCGIFSYRKRALCEGSAHIPVPAACRLCSTTAATKAARWGEETLLGGGSKLKLTAGKLCRWQSPYATAADTTTIIWHFDIYVVQGSVSQCLRYHKGFEVPALSKTGVWHPVASLQGVWALGETSEGRTDENNKGG